MTSPKKVRGFRGIWGFRELNSFLRLLICNTILLKKHRVLHRLKNPMSHVFVYMMDLFRTACTGIRKTIALTCLCPYYNYVSICLFNTSFYRIRMLKNLR